MQRTGTGELTARERQVADLIRDGLSDREIAGRLFISRRTAEWHVKQIFDKLGFNSRAQVAAWRAAQSPGLHRAVGDPPRGNLPLQLTTFVGRDEELNDLRKLFVAHRLVTVVGAGGAGKTRLALEAAARMHGEHQDGEWFIDLAPIRDERLVSRAFGVALRIHERPRQALDDTLVEELRDRKVLLVVDNCEHVIQSCASLVASIVRACPDVTVLATSREPLRVSGEVVWRISPLNHDAALALFTDRARLTARHFEVGHGTGETIAELCRRLDDLPLAIEIAAANVAALSPKQMLERLDHRFSVLSGGRRADAPRHLSLESALDWSHDLLSAGERTLFRRLSIFNGTFGLEAVEAVCSLGDLSVSTIPRLLGGLVDKSLVGPTGERFRLLETVRDYASIRLEDAPEAEVLGRAHCDYFVAVAEDASQKFHTAEQLVLQKRLADDVGNLRSAIRWSSLNDALANLRLGVALTFFWYAHGLVQEGDAYVKAALAGYGARDSLRGSGLEMSGRFAYWRNDLEMCREAWGEALVIFVEIGDKLGEAITLDCVGEVAEWQGDLETALIDFEKALKMAVQLGNQALEADLLRHLGRVAMKLGEHDRARRLAEQSVALFEALGDAVRMTWGLGYLGLNAVESGDLELAHRHLSRALMLANEMEFPVPTSTTLLYFAAFSAAQGRDRDALLLAGAADSVAASAGAVPARLTRQIVERWLDRSRERLGPRAASTLTAEGKSLSVEQAVELALRT